eukprot:gene8995-1325_t
MVPPPPPPPVVVVVDAASLQLEVMVSIKCVLLAAVLLATTAAFAEEARLIVSKDVVNNIAVADRDFTIRYSLYNVGDSEAKEITITDEGFTQDNSGFTIIGGLPSFKVLSLAPGANVTHNVIVNTPQPGYYNLTAARVTYYSAGNDEQKLAFSSMPRNVPMSPNIDFARIYDSHLIEWVIFLAASVTLVALPYKSYFDSVEKHQQILARK